VIRIVDVPVREDLLARLAADASGHEPERLGVVFPNQRAIHHFGVALAQGAGRAQRPPALAPLERFVAELAGFAEEDLLPETDVVHLLWRVVKEEAPGVLVEERREFAAFYPWGRAFLKALDELDREMVGTAEIERIRGLEAFDALGTQAKAFYGALPTVRKGFHRELKKDGRCTKGTVYMRALDRVKQGEARVPEALFFGGFFAFTKGDRELLRALGRTSEVTLYRHHDGRAWEAFKTVERELVPDHVPPSYGPPALDLRLHAAPSAHGEVLAAERLLGEAGSDPERTAVVLPDPERLVPLLWEAVGGLGVEYNITMGYPLVRTPLYALLDQVLRVAETGRSGKVRVLEYLRLLFHPYAKGFGGADSGTRFIVHAVEEVLRRRGVAYVSLRELEGDAAILEKAAATARSTGLELPQETCGERLRELHALLLHAPAKARDLGSLAKALEHLVLEVGRRSDAHYHPFFDPFFTQAADCLHGLASLEASGEPAGESGALSGLVRDRLAEESAPFTGLPVQGLQVMGLLETRALAFERVIVLDANADLLPPVSRHDPLLPPPVRGLLGLPGFRERAEVSKYHLFRLLQSCGRADVIYRDTADKPRSFFLEELLFQVERASGRAGALSPERYAFPFRPESPEGPTVAKDGALLERLGSMTYSASALDQYLRCPMSFYFGYALGLRELETAGEEMDVRRVGSALHEVLGELYGPFVGELLTPEAYAEMLGRLPASLARHFGDRGEQVLLRSVAKYRLDKLLARERENSVSDAARLLGVEVKFESPLTFGGRTYAFKGTLDRLEERQGSLLITDSKSGKDLAKKVPKADAAPPFEDRAARYKALRSLQLPLYAELVHANRGTGYGSVQAQLVSLRNVGEPPAVLFQPGTDHAERMVHALVPAVAEVMSEIGDPERPFAPDPADERFCFSCPFATLCRRGG
jgi:ATP-dependent helicase/nuclease subunit B